MDWIPSLELPALSLAQLLQRVAAALVVVGVHGWAAAWSANLLGDAGPRHDGRRSLTPLVHLDIVGIAHAAFFRVAWIPRIDVEPRKLRGKFMGALVMTLTASVALAALSALLLVVTPLTLTVLRGTTASTVASLLIATSEMAIVTAVFNVLPVPPFLGAAYAPWPGRLATLWRGDIVRWLFIVIVVLLSLTGVTARVGGPIRQAWRAWLGF